MAGEDVTLSLIVVCRNPGPGLTATLESVWTQREVLPELIVVDGASSDGTREWLERHRHRIATLISEPDRGVFDAMNKAVAVAHGVWVLFLGADDVLCAEHTLAKAVARLRQTNGEVLAGSAVYTDGRVCRPSASPRPRARNFLHHQAAFYRRSLFTSHGLFDASLAVMADYDFNLRLWTARVGFEVASMPVSRCGVRGLSDRGDWRGYREEIRVRHRHFAAYTCWYWDAVSVLRYLRKRVALAGDASLAPGSTRGRSPAGA